MRGLLKWLFFLVKRASPFKPTHSSVICFSLSALLGTAKFCKTPYEVFRYCDTKFSDHNCDAPFDIPKISRKQSIFKDKKVLLRSFLALWDKISRKLLYSLFTYQKFSKYQSLKIFEMPFRRAHVTFKHHTQNLSSPRYSATVFPPFLRHFYQLTAEK